MTTTEIFISQYTDVAFWLGSTTGAMLDPILWVVAIVAANVKKHTVWVVVLAAIVWGVVSTWLGVQADTAIGLDTALNWLHLPTRILAGFIIGFSAIQIIKWKNSKKAQVSQSI